MTRHKDGYLLAQRIDTYLESFPSAAFNIVRHIVPKLSTEDLREVVADMLGCSHCGTFGHEVPDCPESEWKWDEDKKDWRQV